MRKSGILMHISSLPNPYGIGSMGKCAYEFIDFLEAAGQTYWQVLPLCPTGYGDSPYQSFSVFAGNPYLIDLDFLIEEGLLEKQEAESFSWGQNHQRVDYASLYENRCKLLRLAFRRFRPDEAFYSFVEENSQWLFDYSLFMVLKDHFGGKPWQEWPRELMLREPEAMAACREEMAEQLSFHYFMQYLFFRQWQALRRYAGEKGIRIIGDVPIYVPLDSSDVWANPQLFQLDENCRPQMVAGVPPDSFTAEGQLWGNPLYRWDAMTDDGYSWWLRRLCAAGKLYDTIRLDHFRGFEAYWSVPYGDETARNGHWVKGPGMDFIRAVKAHLPQLRLIAEDLGFLTEEVREMRDQSGFPGMKVLEFAFDSREPSDYLPHLYPVNSVCYIGTHDNMTLRQWLEAASPDAVAYATEYMGLNEKEGITWGVIRTAMSSVSRLCILQMQDLLELGGEARMNFPGTMTGANWTWRAKNGFTDGLADRLYQITRLYGRLADF